jgi:hypothetical protein
MPLGFAYARGRCSYRPCERIPAVETNSSMWGYFGNETYHLCAHHAQVVGRARWGAEHNRAVGPRIWRWLTTRVLS